VVVVNNERFYQHRKNQEIPQKTQCFYWLFGFVAQHFFKSLFQFSLYLSPNNNDPKQKQGNFIP